MASLLVNFLSKLEQHTSMRSWGEKTTPGKSQELKGTAQDCVLPSLSPRVVQTYSMVVLVPASLPVRIVL